MKHGAGSMHASGTRRLSWIFQGWLVALALSACGPEPEAPDAPPPPPTPPSGLSYPLPQDYVFTVGTTIAPLNPSVTGVVTTYAIAPALPPGLSMDINGVIGGTPTATSPRTVHTARAINSGGNSSTLLAITVNAAITAPPTSLSYSSPRTFVAGTAITPMQPSVTGVVESYGVNPALPPGLTLNTTSGVISGTPTAAVAQATYTVTALNSLGSTSFGISIVVNPSAPTALSYPSPNTYSTGTAIAPLVPSVTGTVTSWSVTPALPAGLSISPTTGVITGTPSALTPLAPYTVTAGNVSGGATFVISITIVAPPVMPPTSLFYPSPRTYVVGTVVTTVNPAVSGPVTSWSILPSLPPGLVFNTGNGSYSGTPTVPTVQGVYRITASNTAGSATFDLTITVNPAPPTNLSYPSPRTYAVGTAITPLDPTVTGTPTGYSVSPALPAGLTLDTTTGRISGTPTAVAPQSAYVITASNISGATSFTLTLTINPAAPSQLSYPTPWTLVVGSPITTISPVVTGTVTSYSVSPALPAGLTLDGSTGVITGTPTTATVQAGYTVRATNVTGSVTFVITITVNALPPSGLSYPGPQTYTVGTAITPLDPTVTGTVTNWTVSPSLPGGLSLSSTGRISGTPLAATAQNTYTVTASNSGGLTSFGLVITVQPIATVPAAPSVTAGYAIKQVVLSWAAVPGATSYRVYKNPSGSSGYSQIGGSLTDTSYSDTVSVHLTDWLNFRYIVSACNSFGCTDSQAVFATDSVKAIGYFKASDSEQQDIFGSGVAISADGNTLAVGARGKDGDATGTGPRGDNTSSSGAVYIFVRTGTVWTQQAFLHASNRSEAAGDDSDQFGTALSLSADGNTLAVGVPWERSNATGINGDQGNNAAPTSGAVYIFTRSGTTWAQQAYIKASNTEPSDQFGYSVSLSHDGNTLAVGATGEDSSATGINGDQFADNAPISNPKSADSGAAYIFVRNGSVWAQQAYVKPSIFDTVQYFGNSISLSGDGTTLAVGSYGAATAGTPFNSTANRAGAVYVFARSGPVWSQQARIQASDSEYGLQFGYSVALTTSGATLAIGARAASAYQSGWPGRAYILARNNGLWSEQAILRPSNHDSFSAFVEQFGNNIAISSDGNILAVSADYESSNATGINGSQTTRISRGAGAVYIFTRVGTAWTQTAYVKASNTVPQNSDMFGGDQFGFDRSLALSGDGLTLAVGGIGEDSSATGIGGDQFNDVTSPPLRDLGAVYLY
jgi:hypothetical protein